MTPKEKALELIHKYDLMQTYIEGFSYDDAKQCALIAVELLLEEIFFEDEPIYWQQVKQEIQNL